MEDVSASEVYIGFLHDARLRHPMKFVGCNSNMCIKVDKCMRTVVLTTDLLGLSRKDVAFLDAFREAIMGYSMNLGCRVSSLRRTYIWRLQNGNGILTDEMRRDEMRRGMVAKLSCENFIRIPSCKLSTGLPTTF